MFLDPLRQERDRILRDIQQRAVVCGPDETRFHVGHHVRQRNPGVQVLYLQGVLPAAHGVFGPGEQPAVRTDAGSADEKELLAQGQLVAIQHHLLGGLERRLAAGIDRVVITRREARVVPVAPVVHRHRGFVRIHPGHELRVELLLQTDGVGHRGVAPGILGAEVVQHLLRLARVVPQPVVLVVTRAVGGSHGEGFAGRDGRAGRGRHRHRRRQRRAR